MKNTEMFYDEISAWYDNMVNFDEAVKKRESALNSFINKRMKNAVDIGCGTGIDSIALARCGMNVTAFDISAQMIKQAKKKSEDCGLDITFIQRSAEEIPAIYNDTFHLAVSLGNTLANIPGHQLVKSIKKIFDIMQNDGVLILQVLNYARILKMQERIVNITRNGDYYYTRFYDFTGDEINFNILRFHAGNPSDRSLRTSVIYPYNYKYLGDVIKSAGFSEIKLWGNFNRTAFSHETSSDFIIEAKKII